MVLMGLILKTVWTSQEEPMMKVGRLCLMALMVLSQEVATMRAYQLVGIYPGKIGVFHTYRGCKGTHALSEPLKDDSG